MAPQLQLEEIAAPFQTATAPATSLASVVDHLKQILADTYVLMVKTHGAHCNVRGPDFFGMHAAFEAQFQALFLATDELAERIRALDEDMPASMARMSAMSAIGDTDHVSADALAGTLRDDHRAISRYCQLAIAVALDAHDEPTADLLIKRILAHDQSAWMLGAVAGS